MTHAPFRSLRATTALCAVLALGSTPAFAQEIASAPDAVTAPAAPTVSAPPVAPEQPAIQLPSDAPAPAAPVASPSMSAPAMTSQPMVEPVPQAVAAPDTASKPDTAADAAPARSVADHRQAARAAAASSPGATPRTAAITPAAPRAAEVSTTPAVHPMLPSASVPLAQPAASAPRASAPRLAAHHDGIGPAAWVAALIVILGAGAGTYFVTQARRRSDEEVHDDAYEAEPAQTYVEPEPVAGTLTAVEPMMVGEPTGGLVPEAPLPAFSTIDELESADTAVEPAQVRETIGSEELTPATAPAAEQRSTFVMPAGPVPRGEARDALLKRMIDAEPDAENPFRSRKARLRRARLILQHLEHQREHEAGQPFDWRTYKPSTSHPAPATPPRVTA